MLAAALIMLLKYISLHRESENLMSSANNVHIFEVVIGLYASNFHFIFIHSNHPTNQNRFTARDYICIYEVFIFLYILVST